MKSFRFHPLAEQELIKAAQHYTEINPQLGQRFYLCMLELIQEIRITPNRYRVILKPARRHFRPPFPYAIIYVDLADEILILAVSAFKRAPGHWQDRLD